MASNIIPTPNEKLIIYSNGGNKRIIIIIENGWFLPISWVIPNQYLFA